MSAFRALHLAFQEMNTHVSQCRDGAKKEGHEDGEQTSFEFCWWMRGTRAHVFVGISTVASPLDGELCIKTAVTAAAVGELNPKHRKAHTTQ